MDISIVLAGLYEKKKPVAASIDVAALDSGLQITSTGLEVRNRLSLSLSYLLLLSLLLQRLGEVSLQCICDLSVSVGHFNYRSRLFTSLVDGLVSTKFNGKVSGYVCCIQGGVHSFRVMSNYHWYGMSSEIKQSNTFSMRIKPH